MAKHNRKVETVAPVAEQSTILQFGEWSVDFTTLPLVSQLALAQQAFSHKMGNEVASKVSAAKEKADKAGTPWGDAETATAKHDAQRDMLERITNGTIGVRVVGPRGTAIETVMRQIALETVKAAYKAAGRKLPDTDGLSANVKAYLAKNGDRVRQLAEDRMAATKADAQALEDIIAA